MFQAIASSAIVFIIVYLVACVIFKAKAKKENEYMRIFDTNEDNNYIDELKGATNKKKKTNINFIDNLAERLENAEMTINVEVFIILILIITLVAYVLVLMLFKSPIVAFSPVLFTMYILPTMIIEAKEKSAKEKFEKELVLILRRMASVAKYGSIQQALEEVVTMQNLSIKTQILFRKIYHKYRYGDSIESAFRSVSEEIDSEIFDLCVISIDLNKELGADLSNTLNSIAKNIQNDMLNQKEAKSLLGQTSMIFMFLAVIPYFIIGYMQISNPELFGDYLVSVLNQFVFLAIFIWMSIGTLVINRLIKK